MGRVRCVCFVFAVALLFSSHALGQPRPGANRPWPQQQPNAPTEKFSGTIKGMQNGVLQVAGENGEQWAVMLRNQRSVSFTGSADSSWLQPGMWVRFSGRFDKKGKSAGAIEELSVFTPQPPNPNRPPSDNDRIGVFADQGVGGSDLFADESTKKNAADAVMSYKVAGRITAAKGGKIAIQAGNAALQVDVSDKARVDVRVDDLAFARDGDKVTIDGWAFPQQKGQILANRLSITASETLSAAAHDAGKKKHPPSKPAKTDKPEKGKPDALPF